MSYLAHLECPNWQVLPADELRTVLSHCGLPLLARYALPQAKRTLTVKR